jgi:alcohol dehydrogenase (cytochrome c)
VPEGKIVWRDPQVGRGNSWGGTLTTAGDLVFFGNDTGAFEAVGARTGRALWQFNTGQNFRGSPMSYAVEGIQHVAIAAGSDVISFALPQE